MLDRIVVVAGNGMSLARILPSRVLAQDFILRTNNFFFEPDYYLGRRVDLAFMGGDPRVAPFMFETLRQALGQYDLSRWSGQNIHVIRAGKRLFPQNFIPMRYRDAQTEAMVTALCARYRRKPTTGTQATLMAHGMGADRIILAGIDLYSDSQRYPFEPGRHHRALMGQDINMRAHDADQHDPDLDRAILTGLAEAGARRGDLQIWRCSDDTALDDLLDLAPAREGAAPEGGAKTAPTDWAPRTGFYPIMLLRLLRRVRALTMGGGGAGIGHQTDPQIDPQADSAQADPQPDSAPAPRAPHPERTDR